MESSGEAIAQIAPSYANWYRMADEGHAKRRACTNEAKVTIGAQIITPYANQLKLKKDTQAKPMHQSWPTIPPNCFMSAPAACLPAILPLAADTTPLYHMRGSLSPHCFRLLSARASRGLSSLSPDVGQARPRLSSTRALESFFSPPTTATARFSHALLYAHRDQSGQVSRKPFRLSETLRHGGPRTRAWRARTRP
jgi:hypothetical protein